MNNKVLKMYVFYCSNSIEQEQLEAGLKGIDSISIKTISLPCSGKIDIPYLMKAFETGADGAAVVTCKKSECRHLEGNLRAEKRVQAVESLLEEIGMAKGRIAVIMTKDDGVEGILNEIKNFFTNIHKETASGSE
jgi:coenzyme F420-reducing hydrogenase delta subunit